MLFPFDIFFLNSVKKLLQFKFDKHLFLFPLEINFDLIYLQHVISEPFDPSPFMPGVNKAFENEFNVTTSRQQKEQSDADASASLFSANEKEISTRENNVAKIKVVVCWFLAMVLQFSPLSHPTMEMGTSFFPC